MSITWNVLSSKFFSTRLLESVFITSHPILGQWPTKPGQESANTRDRVSYMTFDGRSSCDQWSISTQKSSIYCRPCAMGCGSYFISQAAVCLADQLNLLYPCNGILSLNHCSVQIFVSDFLSMNIRWGQSQFWHYNKKSICTLVCIKRKNGKKWNSFERGSLAWVSLRELDCKNCLPHWSVSLFTGLSHCSLVCLTASVHQWNIETGSPFYGTIIPLPVRVYWWLCEGRLRHQVIRCQPI